MTIERGGVWGEPAAEAVGSERAAVASTDADVADLAAAGRAVIALDAVDGDLARTVGIERVRAEGDRFAYPVDLGLARLDDGTERPFVAGLVAHRWLWRGEFAVVANCGWLGRWYVGPRAHPNDGLVDVTVGSLRPTQRLLALRRLPTGSHLPHPDLETKRVAEWEHRFPHPVSVTIDGRRVGRTRSLRVTVRPDCFMLVV